MTPDIFVPASLVILGLPLLAFILLLFLGKRLPRQGDWLATGLLTGGLLISLLLFFTKLITYPEETFSSSFTWIDFGNLPLIGQVAVELGIMVDNLTVIMLVVVTLISTLVHLFSMGYMKGDVRYARYYSYLGLFSFSMLGIVLTSNFLMMYIFWELVGISSFLLIGHWYEKKTASSAANKAFIVNRIGDAGMFIGIMILFFSFSTFTFEGIFESVSSGALPFGSEGWMTAAGLLIFCGAVGKSAQFPLHVWLPDAMEGPTPVSALIHAATMVAAGVYLVARMFPILTADALIGIAYIGAITAFIAATIALTQNDIKKVLAYSTISQLGYMTMALGSGAYTAGLMHLLTHASFKAGLFLGAGSVIFAMHEAMHKQHDHDTDAHDIRNMGGMKHKMPFTYFTFLIFTLAIAGIPLTSGFLSKDEVLAGTLAFGTLSNHYLLPIIGFAVAGMTALYMFRILILTFHGQHADQSRYKHIQESPWVMTFPLVLLSVLSIFIFYSFNPLGASSGWLYSAISRPDSLVVPALQPFSYEVFYNAVSGVHSLTIVLSILLAFGGIAAAFWIYEWKKISADRLAENMGVLYKGAFNKWYFDELYNKVFVQGTHAIAQSFRWFDANIIEFIVNGVATVIRGVSRISKWIDDNIVDRLVNLTAQVTGKIGILSRKIQTGKVQTYLIYLIAGFFLLFILFNQT